MKYGMGGSLPTGSLSILTLLFCGFFIMRSCDICFESELVNVLTNAACLTLPLVGTAQVMASYTTWQQKAFACLFLFPIVLLCTAAFCIYSPRWIKIVMSPSTVAAPFKVIQHEGVNFVVYKFDPRKLEVYEEKDMGIFKLKRFVASAGSSDNVVIAFPNVNSISCTFKPNNRNSIANAHGSIGTGFFETLGFRKK